MTSWPHHTQEEIDAVRNVLESGRVNYWNGDQGRLFEREFCDYHGMPYGIAVANGTVALELALHALGIGSGDEVVVSPRTFVASVSSIILRGAKPVFADVDLDSGNITPESVRRVLTKSTRAIIAVHLAGWPCEMDGFRRLADEFGVKLIEDCAQAHGARYHGHPVGSHGDAAAFSFCTDKIISTGGEGGMLLLRDEDAWRRAWSYKDHGRDWDAVYNTIHPPGFRWLIGSFGTNWRLTEMQSAIGRVQLRRLDEWLAVRRANAKLLIDAFSRHEALRVPVPPTYIDHAYYKFYAYLKPDLLRPGYDRNTIIANIQSHGVVCLHGGCSEVYLEKAFEHTEWRPGKRLPVAKELGDTSMMFLVDHMQARANMNNVIDTVANVLQDATMG